MYFPLATLAAFSEIDGILPGIMVLVEDDFGNVREATLSRVVTKGRPIKKGDKVRLDCSKRIKFKDNFLCNLEFPNSRPKAGTYNTKVPSFSVTVDSEGIPTNLINYH
jgi:hypothetical protein